MEVRAELGQPEKVGAGETAESSSLTLRSVGTKVGKGTPVSAKDAGVVADRVTAVWSTDAPAVEFAPTFSSLSPNVQQGIRDEGGDHTTQGIYHNGVIHIVFENHTSERALEDAIYHEGTA